MPSSPLLALPATRIASLQSSLTPAFTPLRRRTFSSLPSSSSSSSCKQAMKASRDGCKQKAGEPAVLFPRLHVSDTEKVGPRAPPRNKMALFEQFTVPSNRFLPSSLPLPRSSRAAPYSQQYFPMDYGYPCPPYYLQSTLPYRKANVDSHSSHPTYMGVSGNHAVMYGDSESWRVPGMQSTFRNEATHNGEGLVTAHGANRLGNTRGKKLIDKDNIRVPMHNSAARCLQKPSEAHGYCSSSLAGSSAMIDSLNPADSHPEDSEYLMIRSELVPGFRVSKPGSYCKKLLEDHTHELQAEQLCSRNASNQSVVFEPQSSPCSQVKQRYSCEKSVSQQFNEKTCAGGINTGTSSQCTTDAGGSMAGTQGNIDLIDRSNELEEDNEMKSGMEEKLYSCKHDVLLIDQDMRENVECSLGDHSRRNGFESIAESDRGSGEVLELSPPGDRSASDGSDLSMPDLGSAQKIVPVDVMKLVGQQQFWKARDAIIRQQQLFSDQVFELHKLVQVQRMIAETPDSTPDGNMYCDSAVDIDRCNLGTYVNFADQGNRKSTNISVTSAPAAITRDPTDHVPGQGPCSKVDYYPSWFNGNSMLNHDPYGHMYLAPVPYSMAGAVVWGYPCPSLGFPISETLSSDSFGSNQLAELPHSSHTMHSSVRTQQQSQFSMSDNHRQAMATPDTSPFLPPKLAHPFNLQGTAASPSSLTVAHHNKHGKSAEYSRDQITLANVSYESQWVNRLTGQGGFKNFENPISQVEQTNISTSTGACTSNTISPNPNVEGHICGQHVDQSSVAGWNIKRVHHTYDDGCVSNAPEGMLERYPKRHQKIFGGNQESKVPDEAEVDEDNAEHFLNALPLFPLSPGANSSLRERLTSQGEEQGQVIRVTPRSAVVASKSAAGILLSIQQERAR